MKYEAPVPGRLTDGGDSLNCERVSVDTPAEPCISILFVVIKFASLCLRDLDTFIVTKNKRRR